MKQLINALLFSLCLASSSLFAEDQTQSAVELERNQVEEGIAQELIAGVEQDQKIAGEDQVIQTDQQMVDLLEHKRRDDSDLERLVERLVDQLMNQKKNEDGKYLTKSSFFLGCLLVTVGLVTAGYLAKPQAEKQIARFNRVEERVHALEVRAAAWANDLNQRDLVQADQIARMGRDLQALMAQRMSRGPAVLPNIPQVPPRTQSVVAGRPAAV